MAFSLEVCKGLYHYTHDQIHWFGVTVHELRHTAASLMIATGADVKTVQSQLGHKTATMTLDQYGHLFPDNVHSARAGQLVTRSPFRCSSSSSVTRSSIGSPGTHNIVRTKLQGMSVRLLAS